MVGSRHAGPAETALDYILIRLVPSIPDNDISWMAVSLLSTGVPFDHELLKEALMLLAFRQKPDERWTSEDGPSWDIHTTLECLRAFKMAGVLAPL